MSVQYSVSHLSAAAYSMAEMARGRHPDAFVQKVEPGESVGERCLVLVAPDSSIAESLWQNLNFLLQPQISVFRYGAWDVLPFDALSPDSEISSARLWSLYQLTDTRPGIIVTSTDALMQRTISPELLLSRIFHVEQGQEIKRDEFVKRLSRRGYIRRRLVEEHGDVAVRGAVVDVFPPGMRFPVRLELFSDRLESIRCFDPGTQRSVETLECATILPAREFVLPSHNPALPPPVIGQLRARAEELAIPPREIKPIEEAIVSNLAWPGLEQLQPFAVEKMATMFDYLSPQTPIITYDTLGITRRSDSFEAIVKEREKLAQHEHRLHPLAQAMYLSAEECMNALKRAEPISFERVSVLNVERDLQPKDTREIGIGSTERLQSQLTRSRSSETPFQPLVEYIQTSWLENYRVALLVSHESRLLRFKELLLDNDIDAQVFNGSFSEWMASQPSATQVSLIVGHLESGVSIPEDRIRIILDSDILPRSSPRRSSGAGKVRRFLGSLSQLQEDEFIVHTEHGVGLYRGLKQLQVDGVTSDFLEIEYAEGSKLFLPVENINKIQKYLGSEGKKPVLNKLGGKTWAKTKAKVQENVAEIAGQLLTLYAEREVLTRRSFGSVDVDDQMFADSFEFEETPDQAKAIDDVLSDMASNKPMDRLVCGDVGYGKTEVALRAAFKAANAGFQVAVLVPTTVLADQHFSTFKERFSAHPIRVACVSRFFSTEENKETLRRLANGTLDVIVGTHRLLQKDVSFQNLGLIIVDEEHRFGVAHKEKLKRMKRDVDVLTLTATPIPRTLHMSLVNIRDLSVIETPPVDRQVIRTYIATYDPHIVREAILREKNREGQVFFIHNRVNNIELIADELRELVPEASFAIGHGQMKDGELEAIMHRFVQGEVDVLVCTTIVESGLDIPNANTMIIREADKFGLAELYQLRGRVGRSDRRAYAYLLISDPAKMGANAKKRLQVLQSLDDLGIGFRLALQDMEIRGAGNILGKDQSGHVNLVGFELYSRILKDAIRELQAKADKRSMETESVRPDVDPELHVGFPAHIPTPFIPDVSERLLLYQRLANLDSKTDTLLLQEEIEDRFGNPPQEVRELLELMDFRRIIRKASIISASRKSELLSLTFHPDVEIPPDKLLPLIENAKGALKLKPPRTIMLHLPSEPQSPRDMSMVTSELLQSLGIFDEND